MCKLLAHPWVLDFQDSVVSIRQEERKFKGFETPIGAMLWDI